MPLPLALTMGEPAGICGELTLKAWLEADSSSLPPFYVIGDVEYYKSQASLLKLDINICEISSPLEAPEVFASALPVFAENLQIDTMPNLLNIKNAQSVINSITTAVGHIQSGLAGAIITNPIHKSVLYDAGFKYQGHTDFLTMLAGNNAKSVMMLASVGLRVVPVTIHQSLINAIQSLSIEKILSVGISTNKALINDFGIANPRLGIAALNPHAGENGRMGSEEITIIKPAIEKLRALGINASDPLPADTLFHENARKMWDAVLCMYHDQALIPLKTIDFSGAVNITLGLPFIRTSPDHGTALDIAGKGIASPKSLIYAIKQAAKMVGQHG